ncbi:MAG: hypothetical protein ABSE63_04865 [Thermoguttaceae bacterium]|jgi:hypothetical protein
MPDADPQTSGNPIPGESSGDLPVSATSGGRYYDYCSKSLIYFRPPRLGIVHLLAFIAFSTGLIIFYTLLDMRNPRPDHSGIMIIWKGLQVIRNMVTAASLVGLLILLAGKIRGIPGRFQPGHWILIFESIATILAFFLWGIFYFGLEGNSHGSSLPSILMGYERFLLVLAYALLIYFLQEAISWKVLFGALALFEAATGLLYFDQGMRIWMHFSFTGIILPLEIVVLLVLIVTIALDRKNYSFRDRLHWLGLFLIGYEFTLSIISEVVQYAKYGFI